MGPTMKGPILGHIQRVDGDGNGFPGGVRASWPAIAAFLAFATVVGKGYDMVRGLEASAAENRYRLIEQAIAAEAGTRSEADRSTAEAIARIEKSVGRIESALMRLSDEQHK